MKNERGLSKHISEKLIDCACEKRSGIAGAMKVLSVGEGRAIAEAENECEEDGRLVKSAFAIVLHSLVLGTEVELGTRQCRFSL